VRRWKPDPAVPVADFAALASAKRRTLIVRAVLGGGAVGLLVLAVVVAHGLEAPIENVLPQGRSGVVVLDLSRSIGATPAGEVLKALRRLDSPDQRLGLVVFSDTAYELLPAGSPGTELRPIERFFAPIPGRLRRGKPVFPVSPWDDSFRGGTRISTGLRVGWEMLRREGIRNGAVLLVSDLATEANDLPNVVALGNSMRGAHVPVRILALGPRPSDRRLFERIFGSDAFVPEAEPLGTGGLLHRAGVALTAPLPWTLVFAALALLGVLAANELLNGRLTLPEAAT
jgi:hypothetical protein